MKLGFQISPPLASITRQDNWILPKLDTSKESKTKGKQRRQDKTKEENLREITKKSIKSHSSRPAAHLCFLVKRKGTGSLDKE